MIKLSSDGVCTTLGKTACDAEPRLSRRAHLSQHGGEVVSWSPVWQMLGEAGSNYFSLYHFTLLWSDEERRGKRPGLLSWGSHSTWDISSEEEAVIPNIMHWSKKDKVTGAVVVGNVPSRDEVNFFPEA